jgi:large subunit ribosomal protein L31
MKTGIHPQYDYVVFKDAAADFSFRVRSTLKSKDRITWEDGKEYPLVLLDTSSKSHPFYTGKRTVSDTGGRIDKFRKRYGG